MPLSATYRFTFSFTSTTTQIIQVFFLTYMLNNYLNSIPLRHWWLNLYVCTQLYSSRLPSTIYIWRQTQWQKTISFQNNHFLFHKFTVSFFERKKDRKSFILNSAKLSFALSIQRGNKENWESYKLASCPNKTHLTFLKRNSNKYFNCKPKIRQSTSAQFPPWSYS